MTITTSVKLAKEHIIFFNESHINMSAYVRNLISNSKPYKDWKEKDG